MGASSFNDIEKDALGEMMNISLGASATAMSTLLGSTVNITTPVVRVLTRDQFEFKKLEPAVGVEIAYVEGLEGSNIMMFSRNDVRIIVSTLMGQDIPMEQFEMDEINRSAICEVMNQMMGASATAMSEFLKMTVNISTPVSFEIEDEQSFKEKYFPADTPMAVVGFTLEIVGKLESEFLNIMPLSLAKRLLEPFADTLKKAQVQEPVQAGQTDAPEVQPIPAASAGTMMPGTNGAETASSGEQEPLPQSAVQPGQDTAQPAFQQTAQPQPAVPGWNGMPQGGIYAALRDDAGGRSRIYAAPYTDAAVSDADDGADAGNRREGEGEREGRGAQIPVIPVYYPAFCFRTVTGSGLLW